MCGWTSRSGRLHCEFLDILQFGTFLDILHCEFLDIFQFDTFLDILQAVEDKIIFIHTCMYHQQIIMHAWVVFSGGSIVCLFPNPPF